MKKYELLNQLQQEREQAINTIAQLCDEWNLSTVTNQIVINKGKVTAIEITKEDNSTIEMLRETIRQMNQNMNDMQKQHEEEITKLREQYEQQMLDMTSEFENEYECAINKREEQIKELKEKLDFKELLLSEFRDNMDEKIETIHKLENEIEGIRFGYENKIAKLKEEANKPRVKIEVIDDPYFNDEPKEKPVRKQQTKEKEVFDLAYEELESHDGVKVKVRDLKNNIVFYAVKNMKYDKPAYSVSGNKFTRHPNVVKHLYKYDKQLTEYLMNRLSKKFNLQQTIEENINDEQEIVVNVTDDKHVEIHVDEDPMAGAEDIDL